MLTHGHVTNDGFLPWSHLPSQVGGSATPWGLRLSGGTARGKGQGHGAEGEGGAVSPTTCTPGNGVWVGLLVLLVCLFCWVWLVRFDWLHGWICMSLRLWSGYKLVTLNPAAGTSGAGPPWKGPAFGQKCWIAPVAWISWWLIGLCRDQKSTCKLFGECGHLLGVAPTLARKNQFAQDKKESEGPATQVAWLHAEP